ncbi:MAG: CHAT domain-containing protein [Saprospiraceae bacterium]|nr:CHAT domain-containing protein [Candidatus Defluviibacterium haderslevense]
MKANIILLFLIMCVINSASGQTIDSLASHQIDSLIQISRSFTDKGDVKNALEVNVAAETLALNRFGKISKEYGDCCNNHGRIFQATAKDLKEALTWYQLALTIREKVLGRINPDYATSLFGFGLTLSKMGNYSEAEPILLEAKQIIEKSVGKEYKYYTAFLDNLGIANMEIRKYDVAERYYLESLEIREKQNGKLTVQYGGNLINLAKLYYNMAYYEKAEPLLIEAIQIFKEDLKNINHPFYSNALIMLSLLYSQLGQFNKSELLFLENINLIERNIGKENDKYAGSINNLALLYANMGNYTKAEKYFLSALEIKLKISGKNNLFYASSLQNLGVLYSNIGDFKKAEYYYLETKQVFDSMNLKEHPDNAALLANLSSVYQKTNRLKESEKLILESIEIFEKSSNVAGPEYALALGNLANLYLITGDYLKAEPLLIKDKQIIESTLGIQNSEYALALYNLANLYFLKDDVVKSNLLLNELDTLDRSLVKMATQHLSENELQKYISIFSKRQDFMFSFAHNISVRNEVLDLNENSISETCYNNVLFYKGILSDIVENTKFLATLDSSTYDKFNLHRSYLRSLAQEYSKVKSERDSDYVVDLEMKANSLEKDLRRNVEPFQNRFQQVNWKDVQIKLRQNEASIEFIHYKYSIGGLSDSIYYAAMIITKDMTRPYFLPLFEESKLNSLFLFNGEHKSDYVNAIYTMPDRGIVNQEGSKISLYDVLWKPIEFQIKGINKIYFSPSGLLHRINLSAIPVSNEETLADRYQLIELNSTRHLLNNQKFNVKDNIAVLYGGINFEKDTSLLQNEAKSKDFVMASRSINEISFSSIDTSLRGGSWGYLLGTEKEINALEKIIQFVKLPVRLVKGHDATEESIKMIGKHKMPSPRILHIATHGYFFPDPKLNVAGGVNIRQETNVFKISDHPMMRSGLIMAGGNAAWKGVNSTNDSEDGIWTAYEISQMDLTHTELVVLSACETGLGDIQGNEGVYGLQRAFKIAGAKYLIMSLWQVPDKQTSLLMTTFYKKWLVDKLSIPQAFQGAQKELRELGFAPYQWAGFILVE